MHNEDLDPDFVDNVGDRWIEYKVYHHGYKKWMEISGEDDIEESPYFQATSNEINWVNKVKMQAAAQKWVCHAISNTTKKYEIVTEDGNSLLFAEDDVIEYKGKTTKLADIVEDLKVK